MHVIKAIGTIALSILMLTEYDANAMSSEFAKVTGTLTYPRHTELPPDAVVYVSLVNVSPRQDTSAEIVARQIIKNPDQLPIPFKLEYNPEQINSNHLYAIQAHITFKGKVFLSNTSPYPVITQGNPNTVNVIVNPAK